MDNKPNIYEFPDARHIVISGDIHGDFAKLAYKVVVEYHLTNTLVIVAGDCGFGFQKQGYYEDIFYRCRHRLEKHNICVVFVRGNHDNPAYFDGQAVNYKRWKAVPDYSVLKACGHTILCVGGATSVERTYRMDHRCFVNNPKDKFTPNIYWCNEPPVYDQERLNALDKVCAIDTVITHTAPSFCEKKEKRNMEEWIISDYHLATDVAKERQTMDSILSYLKEHGHPLRYWYYGHFHESWHSEIDDVKYNLLDCAELREIE